MNSAFDAIAFDIDGTLYPNYRFYARLHSFILRRWPLLLAFARARKIIRKEYEKPADDFYALQAEVMARFLRKSPDYVRRLTEKEIYTRWEGLFKNVKLFPQVIETVKAMRAAGLKTAVLSDFPLGRKLENLKINGLWDVELCSEALGALKPAPVSFLELQRRLNVPAGRILFVGNSLACDIAGARRCGMKAALIRGAFARRPAAGTLAPAADTSVHAAADTSVQAAAAPEFVFHTYRQLYNFVLG